MTVDELQAVSFMPESERRAVGEHARSSFADADLRSRTDAFSRPSTGHGVWQIANSFGPLILVFAAMYAGLLISYWVVVALAFPAEGLVVRIFAIQHDAGHLDRGVGWHQARS